MPKDPIQSIYLARESFVDYSISIGYSTEYIPGQRILQRVFICSEGTKYTMVQRYCTDYISDQRVVYIEKIVKSVYLFRGSCTKYITVKRFVHRVYTCPEGLELRIYLTRGSCEYIPGYGI